MNKIATRHIRLWIAALASVVIFWLLPMHWSAITRVLISWDCGVALFLLLVYLWMTNLNATQICSRYIEEDEAAPIILIAVILAALLSMVAIVALLSTIRPMAAPARAAQFALAAFTVINSWVLVPTMFTLHYADMFYSTPPESRPLNFPATTAPVFWDFAYFSFTIAAACQTADVSTNQTAIRKVVVAHSVIAFLFNAAILGFAINVTAGLIGSSH